MRITIPNQITIGRLFLAIGFFGLLSFFSAGRPGDRWMLTLAFWVFLVAAIADVVDGFLARLMKQVTTFGRVVDPVVDKVMVLGAFGFFASQHFTVRTAAGVENITSVAPWMVVVILLRELLVSAIRSHREAAGTQVPANWAGKLKMFVQSATACVVLGQLAWFQPAGELVWLRVGCVWLTVVVTALSALPYINQAYSFLLSGQALGGGPAPSAADRPLAGAASAVVAPEVRGASA